MKTIEQEAAERTKMDYLDIALRLCSIKQHPFLTDLISELAIQLHEKKGDLDMRSIIGLSFKMQKKYEIPADTNCAFKTSLFGKTTDDNWWEDIHTMD